MFVIKSVEVQDSSNVILHSETDNILLHLEGDCCSSSYFDDGSVQDIRDLVGERLMSIESVGWTCPDSDPCQCNGGYGDGRTDHMALILKTDKQSISALWRNDSNGYYSGWLETAINGKSTRYDYDGDKTLNALLAD